jgi:hypothetical protein
MSFIKADDGPIRLPLFLPGLNVCLYLITVALDWLEPSSAYAGRAMFAVDIPFSLYMVSSDDANTLALIAVLSTVWWYFIGRIGYDCKKRKIGRLASGLGAILIFVTGAVGASICLVYLVEDFRGDNAARTALIQYLPALALCVGAFASLFYAATSLLRGRAPVR